jgi:hypothetical protein
LKRVTEELEGLVDLSTSIAKLQLLFKSFLELCEGLVSEKRQKIYAMKYNANMEDFQGQQTYIETAQPPTGIMNELLQTTMDGTFSTNQLESTPLAIPNTPFTFSTNSPPGVLDPGWGLFDVQPTLDWLDADFSFFDNEQYQQG